MGAEKPAVVVFAEKELHPFYNVFAASQGSTKVLSCQDGPAWVPRSKADLVFIDCGFRIKPGLEFLRQVKKASPRTMVVFIAEKSSEETVIEAFQSGARCYLRKPVGVSKLRRISRELLKLKKGTKETRSPFVEDGKSFLVPPPHVTSGAPDNLLQAAQFIAENLDGPLDLEACAEKANLSRFEFCRDFKRHFGLSPMRFVSYARVVRAQDLLHRDNLNITEVAFKVGFRDYAAFVKTFKKYTGVPPRKFRKSLRTGTPA